MKKINYIFIGGSPRSGTSLLQKILGNHPNISIGPEFDFMPSIIELYSRMCSGVDKGRQSFFFDKVKLNQVFQNFINELFEELKDTETVYISEKTPSNALVFDKLIEFNKDFKLIFIVRNPKSIISSMKEVYRKASEEGVTIGLTEDVGPNLIALDKYLNKLNQLSKLNHSNLYVIHYEDVILNPEESIGQLFDFLNLPFTQEVLKTQKSNEISDMMSLRSIKSWYSKEMYDRPISLDGLSKWEKNLSKEEITRVSNFFAEKNYPILERYGLVKKKPSFFSRIKALLKPYL